ncbi:hypothetical protein EV182_005884, partial [Spiromyces aspiralis]
MDGSKPSIPSSHSEEHDGQKALQREAQDSTPKTDLEDIDFSSILGSMGSGVKSSDINDIDFKELLKDIDIGTPSADAASLLSDPKLAELSKELGLEGESLSSIVSLPATTNNTTSQPAENISQSTAEP